MIRSTVTVRRHQISPTGPTERAVYREASVGPDGATLVLALQLEPRSLHIPTSAHAAALEEIARIVRIALFDQEQSGQPEPDEETSDPAPVTPDRHQGGKQ